MNLLKKKNEVPFLCENISSTASTKTKKGFIGCHKNFAFICKAILLGSTISCGAHFSVCAQPSYDFSKIQMEQLSRGLVAVRSSADSVFVTWRYLREDPDNITFDIYRDDKLIAKDYTLTNFTDNYKSDKATIYKVVCSAGEALYTLPAQAPIGYLNIPLSTPEPGVTPAGDSYTYSANDASIGDVDGDGNYEIILKWDPSNAHDNSHDGYTGNVLFDCYKLDGTHLWRIDLGRNIRAGAHYTQFMVYDLDGDGKAEVVMKTSDGSVDGLGKVIGLADADYREVGDSSEVATQVPNNRRRPRSPRGQASNSQQRNNNPQWAWKPTPKNQGRILTGAEYLTVFSGETGAALYTTDYVPQRGNLQDWGDSRANRSDRYLACIAYLDGIHPSVVMCRGYYTRTVLAAFDWDGKTLKERWVFDSNNEPWQSYAGQGNHNLRVGDVDGDGCDEIVYGSMVVNNDGTGLNNNRTGHGDAIHLAGFIPGDNHLQIWDCHENKRDGSTLRDAKTGEILFQIPSNEDVGRCMAADIDPTNEGVEMWSLASGGIRNYKGEVVSKHPNHLSCNMAVWWDGDLLRELLDGTTISKYNWNTQQCERLVQLDGVEKNNGTKSNPCLQGDILGDWREEVLARTADNTALRLFISTIPTSYKFWTFLQDPVYRISIATENVAYNQPTQPGFYFGPDLKKGKSFRGSVIK